MLNNGYSLINGLALVQLLATAGLVAGRVLRIVGPENVTVTTGRAATLPCTAIGFDPRTDVIRWQLLSWSGEVRVDALVTLNRDSISLSQLNLNRMRIEGETRRGQFNLLIPRVSERDIAGYRCISGRTNRTAYLDVLVPPTRLTMWYGGRRDSQIGAVPLETEVTVTCTSARCRPPVRFRWFKGSEEIPGGYKESVSSTDSLGFGTSSSDLTYRFSGSDVGKSLRCVADQQYQTDVTATQITLNSSSRADGSVVLIRLLLILLVLS